MKPFRLGYNLALALGMAAASPLILAKTAKGRYRSIAGARLGMGVKNALPESLKGAIWVHALSVGEVGSALPLVDGLAARFPQLPLALSVATAQGFAVAREAAETRPGLHVFVRPLDLPWAVKALVERLAPSLFVLVEGDIWPNLQYELAGRGVPRLLVNGRVSPRTFSGYKKLKGLLPELLDFERILVQSGLDEARLIQVGISPARLEVGGNLKFDSAPSPVPGPEREALARELGLAGRRVIVAGSTHAGEEEICLDAFQKVSRGRPELALLLAPRDVKRGPEVLRLARQRSLEAALVSGGPVPPGRGVVILDVLGKLARCYSLGQLAFVGGSFAPIGGHNLLEPAAQSAAVLHGPVMHNFVEMARGLKEAGGSRLLPKPRDLAKALAELLDNPDLAEKMGQAGRGFCLAHGGAVARAVDAAERLVAG